MKENNQGQVGEVVRKRAVAADSRFIKVVSERPGQRGEGKKERVANRDA